MIQDDLITTLNMAIVLLCLWVCAHTIAFVEKTFDALELSPQFQEVLGFWLFVIGVPSGAFVMSCLMINPGPLGGLCDVVLDDQPGLKICIIYYTFFYSIKNLRLYSNCKLLLNW